MEKVQVWSCGGGTQSIAIAALIVQGKLPKPDWSIIVDTEREKSSTWEYYDSVLRPELLKVGVELIRVKKSDYATVDVFSTNDEHILLPMFTSRKGSGKLPNFCSYEWKRRVLQRFIRANGVSLDEECIWIGFSVDESRRFLRMKDSRDFANGKVRFPLIFDVPMRRQHCIALVKDMGWPTPVRSTCWMCPNQSDSEWREIKNNKPEEFNKAITLERFLRDRDEEVYLHKSLVSLDLVDFSDSPSLFDERPCLSGMCFV